MSRYRLLPAPAQEAVLRDHCGYARYMWNLAVEQHSHWHPGRTSAPGYLEQCRQLTQARAEHPWLAAGSQTVQQQALRDFSQAMAAFFDPQCCSACGEVDRDSRESQAVFRCTACGFACNADVNAAISIAAGHAVTARGGDGITRPVNREPQLLLQ
jgi:ribosomal protein L37AE/L43A